MSQSSISRRDALVASTGLYIGTVSPLRLAAQTGAATGPAIAALGDQELRELVKLVIYIQNEKPADPNQLRNWLSAPKGSFRFAFRFYGPKGKLIDWTYDMPGLVRLG